MCPSSPNRPPIIALGGWMTSGKDAFADRLVERHGWTKLAMGEVILEAMLVGDPWVEVGEAEADRLGLAAGHLRARHIVETVGYVDAKTIADFRTFMQRYSDGVKQVAGEGVWVEALRTRLLAATGPVVFTGCRMPLELELFESLGAVTYWVDRPGVTAPAGSHLTETSLSPSHFQGWVSNDGTLDDLYRDVDHIAWALTR